MRQHIPQDRENQYYIILKHDKAEFDIVMVLEHDQVAYDVVCAMWSVEYLPGTDWQDNKLTLSTYAEELDNGDLVFNPPPGAKTDTRWTIVHRAKPEGISAADLMKLNAQH